MSGTLRKIAHVGIAVRDLDEAVSLWRDRLGAEVAEVVEMRERGLKIAFLPVGESLVELLAPLGPGSEIERFLERRGPGVHHLCFAVRDLGARLDDYRTRGLRVVGDGPALGAEGAPVAFLHPESTLGILVELLEEPGA